MSVSLVQPRTDLIRYAESNMWSSPYNDQQFRLELQRISPPVGLVNTFTYMGKGRGLPDSTTPHHVYTLSGTSLGYWNFINKNIKTNPVDTWVRVDWLSHQRGVYIELYRPDGRIYPRDCAWIMRTYDGAHLLCVERLTNYPLPLNDNFYLRCYTPDWDIYRGVEGTDENNGFQYTSFVGPTQANLTALQTQLNTWSGLGGLSSIYVDGIKCPSLPTVSAVTSNTIVEIFYDPTVYRVDNYDLKTLPDFYSDLDSKRKYIVHPPKVEGDWTFRYFDDCDIYITTPTGKGLYFNINSPDALRQLTHADYSVSSDYVATLIDSLTDLKNRDDLKLQVIYRSTNWSHDLVWEANRIRYLYRLDDNGIINAMTAVHSTLPEWTASGLENSYSMLINRQKWGELTDENIVKALGFNALTQALASSPVSMPYVEGYAGYDVPVSFQEACVAFEYDADGLLINNYPLTNALKYAPNNPTCAMVEFIAGSPAITRHQVIGSDPVTLLSNWSYLALQSGRLVSTGQSDGKWVPAVLGTDYTVTNGVLTWIHDSTNRIGRVIFNDVFLYKDFTLSHLDNSIYFAITEIWEGGGIAADIAPANIYIWMNGHPLILNVDYVMDYPRVFINNKMYLNESGENDFVVAAFGISTSLTQPVEESELGYIVGGTIGVNGRYNIRDGRDTRLIAAGRLFPSDGIDDSEQHAPQNAGYSLNGYPYQVKHVYQTVQKAVDFNNYPRYAEDRDLDNRICTYLTTYCEKPGPVVWPNISDKYRLFSPFLNQIVNAILLKIITIPAPTTGGVFSKQVINELTKDYQWLLDYDPAFLKYDLRYYTINPFSMAGMQTVTTAQLLFITQVNEIYLNSACGIEGYFEVNNNV